MCLLESQTGMFCRLAMYPVAAAGTRPARGLRQTTTIVWGMLCDQPMAGTATTFTYDRLGLMYNGDPMVASAQFAPLLWSNTSTLSGSSQITVTVLPTGGMGVLPACLPAGLPACPRGCPPACLPSRLPACLLLLLLWLP
jgi:hypothetical protein